ncbi:MAG: glycosyltransferase family 2 protein [Candidatus Rokubacteria bacterium]|nr:glycosyltransferase family 2 protein [Candidatus Rokubacteria bacterium]
MGTSLSGPDVSVVVVSYDARALLEQCLRSVAAAAEPLAWETIVVDNASSDGSRELVAREFPEVSLLVNDTNAGFASAFNRGLGATRGRHVLMLNSDAVLLPGALPALARHLDDHSAAGAVAPRLVDPAGRPVHSCFRFPSLTRPHLDVRLLAPVIGNRFALAYPDDDPRVVVGGAVDWASGACLLLRREALDAVGALDERYFMYFEDVDLCRRLWQGGWQVACLPAVHVVHAAGGSSHGHETRLHVERQRSRLIYFSTHHSGLVTALVRGLAVVAALTRAVTAATRLRFERVTAEGRVIRLALGGVGR